MAENRLSSTLKDSGFELYFDPEWNVFAPLWTGSSEHFT